MAADPLHRLTSPTSGAPLSPDGVDTLREPDGRRWPVIDGIPYLRTGRNALVAQALDRLDAGDRAGALTALLADQDDWWTGPAPNTADLARLVIEADSLTLRGAMGLLGFGRVGDYFAHRWSDPTYLAGLALIEAHRAPETRSAFELACGIGHYGREFLRRSVCYTGADVVFAKLWLARHWVAGPEAQLVCFDAASPWPLAEKAFDLVLCQDAFYFLEPKHEILGRLRDLTAADGRLLVGHIHNREADNHSAGSAVSAEELTRFFPDGTIYDDAELTQATVEGRAPVLAAPDHLRRIEAFAVACGGDGVSRAVVDGYAIPPDNTDLQVNPLYEAPEPAESSVTLPYEEKLPIQRELHIRFPSDRYAAEYGPLATYPLRFAPHRDETSRRDAIRRRALVDLPERW